MKSFLLTAFLLLGCVAAQAQTLTKNYVIRATVGDSVLQPGKVFRCVATDVLRIEVRAADGVTAYAVRAESMRMVLNRNMGGGTELPMAKFPTDLDEPCVLTCAMPTGSGPLKFTVVLDGFYVTRGGKRKAMGVPLTERSFPFTY